MTEEEEIMELEEMSTTTTTTFLSQDIFMEILSWLPAKSLISSFKFVCKAWSTIIKDPDFVKMHLNRGGGGGAINGRSNNESLVQKDRDGNTLFQFHPPFNSEAKKMDIDSNLLILKSRLVGSCNGLLCLSVNDNESLMIINPSTRKYKVSPEELIERRRIGFVTYGFGCYYNSITNIDEYKVVRIAYLHHFDNSQSFKFQIDIYSMSSNSWRRWRGIEEVPCGRFQEGSGVFLNEAFHWICCKRGGYAWDTIVSFSIRDEEFGQIQMPPCADDVVDKDGYPYISADDGITLMNVRGCLGKVYFSRTEMMDIELEIWIMKEYGIGKSWTKEFVIKSSDSDPPRELFANPIYSRSMTCFLVGDQILIAGIVFFTNQTPWFNNELNLQTLGYGRRFLYDMNKKKIDVEFRMFDMPHKDYRDEQVDYIETLVSLKSSNNRKRKYAESLRNKPFEDILYFKQQLEPILFF